VTAAAPAADDDRAVAMGERAEEWTIELATAKVDRVEDRIERVYAWEVERLLVGVRAALAAAGSLVVLVVAAAFEEPARLGPWQILTIVMALGASLGVIAFLYAKLGRLYGNYLESLLLVSLVQPTVETD
jgi:hypothetical protein